MVQEVLNIYENPILSTLLPFSSMTVSVANPIKNTLRFSRSLMELAITGRTAWGGSPRSPAHTPHMGINEDNVFHASYPRTAGAACSHVFQMINQVRV